MKYGIKSNIIRRTAVIMIAFCVAFTGLPIMTGSLHASAASYWSNVSGKVNGQTSVTLSWKQLTKKQRKKISGITVFRNGAAAANLSKTAKGFTDSGLKAGTTYTYQLKTYKKVTKKTKMWLNKKTGQWQKKKPAKKYRGKKKTFKKVSYKYSNASKAVTVRTSGTTAGKPASGSSAGTDAQFVNTTKDLTDRTYDLASLPSSVEYGKGTVVFEVFAEGTVTWTSSNTAVATVTSKFSGSECCMTIKGVGKTTITAKSSRGPSKSFVVTVINSAGGGTSGGGTSGDGQVLYEEDAKRELDNLGISYTKVTTTDYLGTNHTYYKCGNYYYQDLYSIYKHVVQNAAGSWTISANTLVLYDRNRKGTFTDGNTTYLQQDGVTFNKTLLDNPELDRTNNEVTPYVEMYNGDFSKLTCTVKNVEAVSTYARDRDPNTMQFVPITKNFVMKDEKRLAKYDGETTTVGNASSGHAMQKKLFFTLEGELDGLGFVSGNIQVDISYDGSNIATWSIPANIKANAEGLNPMRQGCLNLANEALEAKGKTDDYDTDMLSIMDYIYETYPYGYKFGDGNSFSNGAIYLTCLGGALTLETYSIYKFGVYGFDSWGQYRTEENAIANGASDHHAFHLDSNPKDYYQTNGYQKKP